MAADSTEPLTIEHLYSVRETDSGGIELSINRDLAPDEWDDRTVEVLAVHGFVSQSLLDIDEAAREGDPRLSRLTPGAIDGLQRAAEVGRRVQDHGDAILDDFDALPDELQDEVRRTLVPVGKVYGADMTMDELGDSDSPIIGGAS